MNGASYEQCMKEMSSASSTRKGTSPTPLCFQPLTTCHPTAISGRTNSNIGTQRYVPIYVGMAWQTLMATNLEPHVVEAMFSGAPKIKDSRRKTALRYSVLTLFTGHLTQDTPKKDPKCSAHITVLTGTAEGSTPVPGVSNNPQAVSFFSFRCVFRKSKNQDFDAQPPYACLTALIQQARFDCHNGCIPRASAFWHARLGQSTQASRTVN
ncbi:hypothetical protein DFP72DRAFT_843452 [Ephemerocybe angulata]|nr:hypothetical protein DFP72DRAFT_1094298 [Tulosesus angulatus]KAF6760553.1 hypothetical protein DFP72DRAFT_843452 [Tulosesus angulatus]